ncbi:MAG: hypothetical protein WCI18_04315 [Pseudomonadota bacterium]
MKQLPWDLKNLIVSLFVFFAVFSCRTSDDAETDLEGTVIQICPPFQTPLERSLWLSLPAHYVAKKLFKNYMNCKAKELKLTAQEMVDLYARPIFKEDSVGYAKLVKFSNSVTDLEAPLESEEQSFDIQAISGGGTLGTFSMHFKGVFRYIPSSDVTPIGMPPSKNIVIEGQFSFYDRWDFDPKAPGERIGVSGDPTAEARTRIAGKYMSGRSFDVTSEVVKGRIETNVTRIGTQVIVGALATFAVDGVKPSQESFPTFSPLGLKLVKIVRESKDKNFSLPDILKILKETCESDEDSKVKESCPDLKNLN